MMGAEIKSWMCNLRLDSRVLRNYFFFFFSEIIFEEGDSDGKREKERHVS